MKTEDQIELMRDKAMEMENFSGQTYQDGVIAGLEWVLGLMEADENPVD